MNTYQRINFTKKLAEDIREYNHNPPPKTKLQSVQLDLLLRILSIPHPQLVDGWVEGDGDE